MKKSKLGYYIQYWGKLVPIFMKELAPNEREWFDYVYEAMNDDDHVVYVLEHEKDDPNRRIFDLIDFLKVYAEWYHAHHANSNTSALVIKFKKLHKENEESLLLYQIYG